MRVRIGPHARSRARIDRLCAEESDARAWRAQVLEAVRGAVLFDSYAWVLTDPVTAVGSDPLAAVPELSELPRLVRLKYLTPVNRWTALAAEGRTARSLVEATSGDLTRSLAWREALRRHGVVDVASMVLADRHGCWGFLDLWRTGPAEPFAAEETQWLADLAAPLTEATRRRHAATFGHPAVARRRDLGPLVVVVGDDLEVTTSTSGVQEWIRELLPAAPDRPPVPAAVYNVAAQLLAREHGVDSHDPSARVHLGGGFWVTLRAARLDRADAGIAVTLEETSPLERLDLFVRTFGLSPRERELMTLLATGADTRDLARRLFLSELTVQDHLKSIFAKTGASHRGQLLSRALGARSGDAEAAIS